MLSKLRLLVKLAFKPNLSPPPPQIKLQYRKLTVNSSQVEIVDINMDDEQPISDDKNYTDLSGSTTSPIDIDPWLDEEAAKEGTVDMEMVEKFKKVIEYVDPPQNRSGLYVSKDIEIWLPPKMLSKATYRYDLDESDKGAVHDDTRICKFED